MSKERLLQIVNRLELSPKDKKDLVKEINTNTEKIEKLLENVPEDLDTLKEIINTPSDFLNNNHELGGMINMPFGYYPIHPNTYTYDGSIGDFDIGFLENWFFNKIVISIHTSNTVVYNVNDITGIDNAKHINGPVKIYVDEDKHLHLISTYRYSSFTFTFSSFTNYKTLPLFFTTPYIVGNDTQEHLDELKRLCSDINEKHIPFMVINTAHYGQLKLVNVILGGPSYFWVISGSDAFSHSFVIQFPSKDISALEVGQNVEDIGAIITYTAISPTPDWNVNEGEAGYIENRTHYEKYTRYVESDFIYDFNVNSFAVEINPDSTGHYNVFIEYSLDGGLSWKEEIFKHWNGVNTALKEAPSVIVNVLGGNFGICRIEATSIRIKLKVKTEYEIIPLNEIFIPDTIARVANYGLSHIKLDISQTDSNVTTLNNINLTDRCICDLYNGSYDKENTLIHNGELYNGTITGIKEGKLVQYDVNFETGEITLKQTTDLELIASEVKLDVCAAGSIEAARNLELLNKAYFALGDHFTVNIDAGIGVAKFIPEAGGEGHITTAEGVNVHYTIGADGSVVKTMEIDIVELYNKVEAMSITE